MIIDHLSDAHIDNGMLSARPLGWLGRFDFERYRSAAADVLIVAGDTANHARDTADFLMTAARHYPHVVAVNGNHERLNPARVQLPNHVHLLDDVPGRTATIGGVAFTGGCLSPADEDTLAAVVAAVDAAHDDPVIKSVVVVSHYVPTAKIGDIIGSDIGHKCNDLLDRLPTPTKPSLIVFGHLHMEVNAVIDGWLVVSNPRGYRARRRDGSTWSGFQRIEI